ncbi:MAG: hypothetical protein ACLTUM_06120 [Christensenellales bacterium]
MLWHTFLLPFVFPPIDRFEKLQNDQPEDCGSQRCHAKGADIAKRTCKAAEAAKQVRLIHIYNGLSVQCIGYNIPMAGKGFF